MIRCFDLLHKPNPNVPMYADGFGLFVFAALLTSYERYRFAMNLIQHSAFSIKKAHRFHGELFVITGFLPFPSGHPCG